MSRYVYKGDVLVVPLIGNEVNLKDKLFPESRYYQVMTVEPINDCAAVFVDPSYTVVSLQVRQSTESIS